MLGFGGGEVGRCRSLRMEVVDGRKRPGAFAVLFRNARQLAGERDRLARRERVSGADDPVI